MVMLIKREIDDMYNIFTIDKCINNILGVKFVNKANNYTIVLFVCYIAPFASPYGKNITDTLGHLIAEMYLNNDSDQIYLCGEYNGRIGELSDAVEGIDIVPKRTLSDNIVHGHGELLIDFMQDAKLCILNGRISPEIDNYTCISPRGASVVDYIITPHDVYYKCPTLNIYIMTELMDKCNLSLLIGNRCKSPDHSILHVQLKLQTMM